MKKGGQFSMEFLFTVGFALVMIIPLMVLFYDHTSSTKEDLDAQQSLLIARKIADSAKLAAEPAPVKPIDIHTRAAEDRLRFVLGTRVRIIRQGTGGRIEIDFGSEEELIRIHEQLAGKE